MSGNSPQGYREPNIDVVLSTRSSQATVASILAQLDVALSTRSSQATVASILAQLDVALSTRASEATVATLATQATVASILAQLDVALSTRSSQATVASILTQLDVTQTVQTRLSRWGRNVDPTWIHGTAQTAPGAATVLVTRAVTGGTTGYFYGFLITAQEANDFLINWTSGGIARSIRITFGGKGTLESVDVIAVNEGLSADAGTNVTITNVNAGGAGMIYQARLLYTEV